MAAWLITISFAIDNYWSSTSSLKTVQKKLSSYIHAQENDFKLLMNNRAIVQSIATTTYNDNFLEQLTQKKYFLFFYTTTDTSSETLVCWNTQKIIPLTFMLYGNENKGFVKLDNGYYVWERRVLGNIKSIALIPIKWNYFIVNDYLKNDFTIDENISLNYDITNKSKNAAIISSTDSTGLFYIYEKQRDVINKNNPIAIALQIVAIFFVMLFIHLIAAYFSKKKSILSGGILLIFIVYCLRTISYYYPIPFNFRQFEVFDPSIYSTGNILKSLGDLFINTSIFIWVVLFFRTQILTCNISLRFKNSFSKWFILILFSSVILLATYTVSNIIRSLIVDSRISFDVINFFTLDKFSIIGFIVLCLLTIGYFFLCQILLNLIKPHFPKSSVPLLLTTVILGLLILTFRIGVMKGGFEIYVLMWVILFLLIMDSITSNLIASKIISTKLVFWLVFFSVSISFIILIENNKKEVMSRRHYAEILSLKSDPVNETLINSMLTVFRPDFLSDNFYRLYSPFSNTSLKDSLISSNTSGYTNKYETHVYSYTADENPLFNEDSTRYNDLNAILNAQAKPTSISGLYYFDQSFDQFSYLIKKTIKDTANNTLGYIFILARPKAQRKDALYPELFTKGENNSIENSSAYAFALYNNWKLVSSHNDYPFPSVLKEKEIKKQEFQVFNKENYNELWYYAGAGKVVIIAKENNLSIASITLFSYLFCSFLLVSGLLWLINILITARFNRQEIISYWQLSLRNQIHGTIIFISVISFLVIGFATIMFFVIRYETNNREKLSRTIRIMEKEVKSSISSGWKVSDTSQSSNLDYDKRLEQAVGKISDVHGVDVNLYDLKGNLRISSLPLPYTKGILSTKMNPIAYYHLNNQKEIQFFQKENIGNLTFVSNYIPVIDAEGNNYAYLNIPYFTSQNILKQEISNFLITIINLNAFIFLIAGIISLFITNRITNTFSLITEKMKKINLGIHNEAIEWKRNDEIGALVMEYNKMVNKLEVSAAILAKTEREGAWKEMARQVAHEIKNPLTPMKLSMQFLQRSIENNAPNINELARNVSITLIEQMDHLSNIANAFSQFAHIGESKKELFDINETLRNIILLYEANDNLQILQQLLPEGIIIDADKTQMNRLFTNLILNAIQSVPANRTATISITQTISEKNVIIKIKDNGQGIREEIKSKIFTPNFTTKSSGTGLGLAMCKRIVEQVAGEIWFDTIAGEGTTFFVKIPLSDEA